MRCKNCKKTVENENLLRCPHCGKPLPKKKQVDKKQLARTIGFVFITVSFFIFSFLSFFFQCSYYSSAVMIVGIVLCAVCIPFALGGIGGLKKKHTEMFAAVMSLPFIANWLATFIMNNEVVDFGGFCTVYYWTVLGAVLVSDVLLILSSAEVIKNTKIVSFVSLGLTLLSLIITPAYFIYSGAVQSVGIVIITIENIMPTYMAFHVLNKEE